MNEHMISSDPQAEKPIRRSAPSPRWRYVAAAAVGLSSAFGTGCLERTVSFADEGGSGGAGSTVATGNTAVATSVVATGANTAASGGTSGTTAVALTPDQLPDDAQPCGFNTCNIPADMLFIEISSLGNSCEDPRGPSNDAVSHWRRGIGLPAQYQAVGTYSLADPTILFESGEGIVESGSASATGATGAGAGAGTIQVVSIDATSITVKFLGTSQNFADEDGVFVAPRCATP